MTRNRKTPILTFDLTLTRHVTTFGKFRGCFRIVSSRAFERRVTRFSAVIRSRVMTWGRLTPPPPTPPASHGWRNTPATAGLRYRDTKDSVRKFVKNHYETILSFLAKVKTEVIRGQRSILTKIYFYESVFDLKDRRTILAASCLSRQGASKHI